LSVAFVLALLQFGPAPARRDSLAALIQTLKSTPPPPEPWATAVGDQLVFADSGADLRSTQLALAGALEHTLTRTGKAIDVHSMTAEQRALVETLFIQLDRMRSNTSDAGGSSSYIRFNSIRLLTSTSVSAHGLD
jgi:hypothetical protein